LVRCVQRRDEMSEDVLRRRGDDDVLRHIGPDSASG
jgi:hypothetical protein